jgi:hypothetical protein
MNVHKNARLTPLGREPDRVDGFLHPARRMRLDVGEAEGTLASGDDAMGLLDRDLDIERVG